MPGTAEVLVLDWNNLSRFFLERQKSCLAQGDAPLTNICLHVCAACVFAYLN